jgi:hypothetical protein
LVVPDPVQVLVLVGGPAAEVVAEPLVAVEAVDPAGAGVSGQVVVVGPAAEVNAVEAAGPAAGAVGPAEEAFAVEVVPCLLASHLRTVAAVPLRAVHPAAMVYRAAFAVEHRVGLAAGVVLQVVFVP